MGIEPTYAAWEAAVLPLNYTRTDRAYNTIAAIVASRLLPSGASLVFGASAARNGPQDHFVRRGRPIELHQRPMTRIICALFDMLQVCPSSAQLVLFRYLWFFENEEY